LIRRNENFYIVYPKKHCKQEYKERFLKRGNKKDYIERFMENWDSFVDKLDKVNCRNKISLRTGQYLSDVISRIR
jgi:adenylate kinase family enzyme